MTRPPRPSRAAPAAALLVALPMAVLAAGGAAQQPSRQAADPPPIQDNSFLLEEAYNQERRVVQHISAFTHFDGGSWVYTFTQEWPLGGQRHQLSYTIPVQQNGGGSGVGDVALNYRYQAVGSGDTRVAVAPRLSVLLPTGSVARGIGAGSPGVQLNVPLSLVLSPRLVTHANAGMAYTHSAETAAGFTANTTSFNLGQSVIWLLAPSVNLMLEAAWAQADAVVGPAKVARVRSFFISPGVRAAVNFRSGLQIVPGLAVPLGVGPSGGTRAVLGYLSFEHPF